MSKKSDLSYAKYVNHNGNVLLGSGAALMAPTAIVKGTLSHGIKKSEKAIKDVAREKRSKFNSRMKDVINDYRNKNNYYRGKSPVYEEMKNALGKAPHPYKEVIKEKPANYAEFMNKVKGARKVAAQDIKGGSIKMTNQLSQFKNINKKLGWVNLMTIGGGAALAGGAIAKYNAHKLRSKHK